MKTYTTYEQIKNDYPYEEDKLKAHTVFTDYVMDIISLKQRREIRNSWNKLPNNVRWEDYLLQQVNNIKN